MEWSVECVKNQKVPSPFKRAMWVLVLENYRFEACFGYGLLELLIRLKGFPHLTKEIWSFFKNDKELKEVARMNNKLEFFICFHRLLNFIYLEKYVKSVRNLREFILSKDYWMRSIEYYFSIANPLENIPVCVIEIDSQSWKRIAIREELMPVVMVYKNAGDYFCVDIEELGEFYAEGFPNTYYNGLDLSYY